MSITDSLLPLTVGDLSVGKPLPWPVYGADRKLLLQEGAVIETAQQAEAMVRDGACRGKPSGTSGQDGRSAAAKAEQNVEESHAARSFSFEEVKPRVGDSIKLQINDERYPVTLIGYVKGRTVMVSTPVVDGGVILLRDGLPVVVRSFSGKDAYAFSSSILRVCNTPLPYLHLAYPRTVQGITVRKSARAEFNLIGTVTNTSNPDRANSKPMLIRDMSINGASFTIAESIAEKGDSLSLSFRVKLDDIETSVATTVNCIVRSIVGESEIGSSADRKRYGVQFTDVPMDVSLLMQNMIYQKLLERA